MEAEFRSRLSWFLGVSEPVAVDPGALTYESAFGLREKAFSLSADPRFFFAQSQHGKAFNTLAAGVRRREGILVVTGEVGTGKTTLCRAVLQALDRKTFAAFVPDPFLTREDLLKTLLVEFGVVSADEIRRGLLRNASRTDLCYPLYHFLGSLSPLHAFAVVMIDDAQNLAPALLEEIRILSDLERGEKLLEVVLVGQPELEQRLGEPAMRQLSQRVAVRCDLGPLPARDVGPYIAHRLAVAGGDGHVCFSDSAAERVHAASAGIPRVVNLICDGALSQASKIGTSSVDADCVTRACAELKIPLAAASAIALVHSQRGAGAMRRPPADPPVSDEAKAPPAPESLVRALHGMLSDDQASPPGEPLPNFWPSEERPQGDPGASTHVSGSGDEPASSASASRPRSRWLAVGGGVLTVAALGAYQLWPSPPSRPTASAQPTALREPTPGPPIAEAASRAEPAPAAVSDAAARAAPAPAPAAGGIAILVATFQSGDRVSKSMQELREAGLSAFSADVPLRDGARALAVYVGPYVDRADAERDWEKTRQLPGYESSRIVSIQPKT